MTTTNEKIYTEGQFLDFVELCFGDVSKTGSGSNVNYTVVCPACRAAKGKDYSKKKLAIKLSGSFHLAKCWVCGYKSNNLLFLIRRYKGAYLAQYLDKFLAAKNLSGDNLPEEGTEKVFSLPEGFVLLAKYDNLDSKTQLRLRPYISYLKIRYPEEFGSELLWKWKFGVSLKDQYFRNRIIMPSFDASGELNYHTSRAIDGRMLPKYLNPFIPRENIVFNDLAINWSKPLVIVEGPFDLIKSPDNSTCLLGSDLTEDYLLFQKIASNQTPVILALDGDETGRRKTEQIALLLHEYGVEVGIVDYPYGVKDPGDISRIQFNELIQHAKSYSKVYSIKNKIANLL